MSNIFGHYVFGNIDNTDVSGEEEGAEGLYKNFEVVANNDKFLQNKYNTNIYIRYRKWSYIT